MRILSASEAKPTGGAAERRDQRQLAGKLCAEFFLIVGGRGPRLLLRLAVIVGGQVPRCWRGRSPPATARRSAASAASRAFGSARAFIARSPRWCRLLLSFSTTPIRRARRGCGRILSKSLALARGIARRDQLAIAGFRPIAIDAAAGSAAHHSDVRFEQPDQLRSSLSGTHAGRLSCPLPPRPRKLCKLRESLSAYSDRRSERIEHIARTGYPALHSIGSHRAYQLSKHLLRLVQAVDRPIIGWR